MFDWKKTTSSILVSALLALGSAARANNEEANESFKEGLAEYAKGDYKAAAKSFKAAELFADDSVLKAKSLIEATKSYRKAELRFEEFKCVEKLINVFPNFVNFTTAVDREFEIGNEFYAGLRDPLPILSWLPWEDRDRTIEIYTKALKHAPFSKHAPDAKLRLARMYIDTNKKDDALKTLREAVSMYPNTNVEKYAMLDLANALMQLAGPADGDGRYANEARDVLRAFIEKYPDAPEADWAKTTLVKMEDVSANRLYNIAKFYKKIGREEPASRYLGQIIKEYPNADAVENSEDMLTKIDTDFKPDPSKPPKKAKYQIYKNEETPAQLEPILVVPENSGNKWLLPVRDLKMGVRENVNETQKTNNAKGSSL